MPKTATDQYPDIRDAVHALCADFPDEYHRSIDAARGYPEAFVDALTKAGWLAAMIPAEYGGSGLGLAEASVVMEEINRSGGNSGACHGQMYNMGTLLRHGSEAQKRLYLPKIASGEWRLQSMGVTEPGTGTDTTKIKTTAVKSNPSHRRRATSRKVARKSASPSQNHRLQGIDYHAQIGLQPEAHPPRPSHPCVDRQREH